MQPSTKKQRQLIGIACGKLRIDRGIKADMIRARYGVESTTQLDRLQAAEFLRELQDRGFKISGPARFKGRPDFAALASTGKLPMIRKIEAYLAEAKRPWAYAHGIAQQMFNVKRLEWLDARQLRAVITALQRDAEKHGRFTG